MKNIKEAANEYFLSLEKLGTSYPAWPSHSKSVAMIAEKIAQKCGMDSDEAYAAGLLHDVAKYIGREEKLTHPVNGYKMLINIPEFKNIAHICLTHTFYGYYEVDLQPYWNDMLEEDVKFIKDYMETHVMTDLDLLIQLADTMSNSERIMTISDRFCDILLRHRTLNQPGERLEVLFAIKQYFDKKCGMNIYELFRKQITDTAMLEPNPWVVIPEDTVDIRGDHKKC